MNQAVTLFFPILPSLSLDCMLITPINHMVLFQEAGHLNLITVTLRFCKAMFPSSPLLEITEACNLCSGQKDLLGLIPFLGKNLKA